MSSCDVLVVGATNMDLSVYAERIPVPGETILGTSIERSGGGKGANQAVAAARAGASVKFVSAVGNDADGETLLESLRADGIDVTDVVRVEEPTGMANIVVSADGENSIVVIPGANHSKGLISRAGHLRIPAKVALFSLEVPLPAVSSLLAGCEADVKVLNAAPMQSLSPEMLAAVDVLVVNEVEAQSLAGVSGEAAFDALLCHVPAAVVTLGARGVIVLRQGQDSVRVPSITVNPINTTGAGDTFCGYLCAELARGTDLVRAARLASIAGALATTRLGAQDSIPQLTEVMKRDQDEAL